MTLRQFLKELRASPCRFRIRRDGRIRTKAGRCPIQALADYKRGKKLPGVLVELALVTLDLSAQECWPIIFAADGKAKTSKERRLRKVFESLCE